MATAAEIRQRIRNNLESAELSGRPFVHLINGAINNSVTSVVVDDGGNFTTGDIIEFEDGEQCWVQSVSTNTLTVIRGWNNTTAASQSDNAVIRKNPKWTVQELDAVVSEILLELEGEGIFEITSATFSYDADDPYWYDITNTGDVIDVLSVYYVDPTFSYPMALSYKYLDGLNAGADNNGIMLLSVGELSDSDTVYWTYSKRITEVTQLAETQEDLVVNGATARILGKANAPLLQDPGKRTNRNVQPGAPGRDANWYEARYQRAVWAERARVQMVRQRLPQHRRSARARRWKW